MRTRMRGTRARRSPTRSSSERLYRVILLRPYHESILPSYPNLLVLRLPI